MRRSGRRITASLLAVLMIASTVFGNVTVAHATEVATIEQTVETENEAVELNDDEVVASEESEVNLTESAAVKEQIYFSEYIEGSSNNKALEIYNGTGKDINLNEYKVCLFSNGSTDATNKLEFDNEVLKAGKVFVICHASANDAIKAVADVQSTVCNFNGDDAVALYHNDNLIDVIGVIGTQEKWADGNKKTTDCTLIRNNSVSYGTSDFSFDEWTGYAKDTVTYLGVHPGEYTGSVVEPTEVPATEEPKTEVPTQEPATEAPVEKEYVTIAEAKAMANGTSDITVKGIVVFIDGKNVYVQDDTAGIDAYFTTVPSDIAIGDTILVKGKRAAYNGLEELSGAELVETISKDTKLPLTEITLKELLDDYSADGKYECTRVLVKNVTIGATGSNTPLTDADGNSINIYKMPALSEIKEGDKVDVTAVVGDFKGIQLRVVNADDVKLADGGEDVPPVEDIYDPIADDIIANAGAINVKEAAAATSGEITVVGQVVYAYASKAGDTLINIVLEDVVDGEIYGYLVYDYTNYKNYVVGDIVKVTGTATLYSGVPELTKVTSLEVLSSADAIEAQKVTLSQLGADYLSEYVMIEDVVLGEYKATGNTTVKDSTGSAVIYKGAAYPDGVATDDVVTIYACCSAYNTTYQLRNGVSSDYKVKGDDTGFTLDESVVLTAAKFAGTGDINDATVVYGDLYAENDFADKATSFSAYKAGKLFVPILKNGTTDKATGVTNYTYSLGSNKGMTADEGDYFIFKMDASHYGNMELNFRTRGSASSARNFVVEYSIDGENFKACGDTHMVASYTQYASDGSSTPVTVDKTNKDGEYYIVAASKYQDVSVKLPAGANAAKTLYIKVRVKDAARVDNKDGAISSSATTYMQSITIKANPVVSDSVCQYVSVSPAAGEVGVGQELTFTTGTKGANILYRFGASGEFKTYDASAKPVITELPCVVTVYATKAGLNDSIKSIYNFEQKTVETVKIAPNGGAVNAGSKVKLTCETEGATILYAVAATELEVENIIWSVYEEPVSLKELPCVVYAKATLDGCKESAVKSAKFVKKENEKYGIYFGQMHSHTNYSDGAGSASEAFEHAKATSNLDFLFITDHSNSFDNCDAANINDGSMSSEWNEGHELAKKYTTDKFVAAMGYEMTWSNGLGHMNTFNSNGFQSRTQADYKTYATALNNYYKTLQTAPDSINQFNHPGTTFGDFQDFAYYTAVNDDLITLIEVGNGEGTIGSSGYFPSYEYYQRALDKGWHVSPTNNQDNHKGKWGSANTARSVVLADMLTEEAIYDAMRNYRVYATEDNDLSIYYTLDDYVMGSVLTKDMCGDKVTLKVDLEDPTDTKIGTVQVIANGGIVVDSKKVDSNKASLEFVVDNKYSFYYIKVTEADKDIAVTSPVWVGEVEAAGINAITTSTTLPIKDEALDITLDLYNNEKSDLEINSIEFAVDGKVVKNVDLEAAKLTKVGSENTATYTFDYTYDKVGAMTMEVTVKATLNGVEKIYSDKLSLTYVSNDLVAHVVVDGSHYNDYVMGYYGGNMGNFTKMAADKNVKVDVVTSKFTKDTLKNADLLIVSAPAKKTGTANAGDYVPSHYEDEFIALVKDYVANGGSVIVCGLADYQDSTNGQTATEQNKLLEAIGATIRMNSDEAYDEVKNGGQAYRLYYENFNMDSKWMKDVIANDGKGGNFQTYSAYSGCTVDITNAKANDVVNEAVALVKGFDSTYSIDCKKADGSTSDSSVYVEKGKVVALAAQETKFGGSIFVGGSVFMSDFEVKASLDNNDDLQYANYTIVNNILEAKKVVMKASPISEVRKANMGDVFAIEGYVANGTENENTKFFDTIYVEDETAGITVFPFATSGVKNGTKIRLVGYVDAYQGDKELQIVSYEILDDENLKEIIPTELSVKDSMDYENHGGSLVKVIGKVARVEIDNGVVSEFWLTDGNGNEAAIFIDGYITSATTGKNTISEFVTVGATVEAQGFLYKHPEGDSDVSVPVLRVANCDTIQLVEVVDPEKEEALRKAMEELEAAKAELDAVMANVAAKEEAVAAAQAELDKANAEFESAKEKYLVVRGALDEEKEAKKVAVKKIEAARAQRTALEEELVKLEEALNAAENLDEKKEIQNKIDETNKAIVDAKADVTAAIKELNAVEKRIASATKALEAEKEVYTAARLNVQPYESALKSAKTALRYAKDKILSATKKVEKATKKVKELM